MQVITYHKYPFHAYVPTASLAACVLKYLLSKLSSLDQTTKDPNHPTQQPLLYIGRSSTQHNQTRQLGAASLAPSLSAVRFWTFSYPNSPRSALDRSKARRCGKGQESSRCSSLQRRGHPELCLSGVGEGLIEAADWVGGGKAMGDEAWRRGFGAVGGRAVVDLGVVRSEVVWCSWSVVVVVVSSGV